MYLQNPHAYRLGKRSGRAMYVEHRQQYDNAGDDHTRRRIVNGWIDSELHELNLEDTERVDYTRGFIDGVESGHSGVSNSMGPKTA